MSFPSTLYNLLESGLQGKVTSALRMTRKLIVIFEADTYRDSPPVLPGVAGALVVDTGADPNVAFQVSGCAPEPTVAVAQVAATTSYSVTAKGASSTLQDDAYTHVPKRFIPKLATLVEFWDSEVVGHALTMTVTTTSGSATITVPDSEILTPGQAVSGTGIPTGAKVLSTLTQSNGVITRTTAVLTHKCTGSADVEATFTGGNKVGEFLQKEHIGWCAELSTPT